MKYYTALDTVRHVDVLAEIFPVMRLDRANAWEKLKRLERRAARHALRGCNGPEWPEGEQERDEARILAAVDKVTGYKAAGVPVFLNGDPRGYSLKIDDKWTHAKGYEGLHTDFGGYGILAPEFK